MGLLDSIKGLFKSADKVEKTIDDVQAQAKAVTGMIPGDADDKFVDQANKQVDDLQNKFDDVKKNIPGQGQ
ncbi:MAG: hypothetical protein WAT17_01980 [Candidatus Saccharimonadales bacterium]|jgi:archaellum component FlaC